MERKAIIKPEKQQYLDSIVTLASNNPYIVFCNYNKITVKMFEVLRRSLKDKGSIIKIIRTNIARLALQKALPDMMIPQTMFVDNTFLVYGSGEINNVVKELKKFYKDKQVVVKGAVYEGTFYNAEQAQKLADIPTKLELVAMFLNVASSPLTGFVRTLNSVIARLPTVLSAIADKK